MTRRWPAAPPAEGPSRTAHSRGGDAGVAVPGRLVPRAGTGTVLRADQVPVARSRHGRKERVVEARSREVALEADLRARREIAAAGVQDIQAAAQHVVGRGAGE